MDASFALRRPKTFARKKSAPPDQARELAIRSPNSSECRRRRIPRASEAGRVIDPGKSVLAGKRIVVTRAAAQAIDLPSAAACRRHPHSLPVIQILPPEDFAPLDSALGRLNEFDWVLSPARTPSGRLRTPGALASANEIEHPNSLCRRCGRSTATEAAARLFASRTPLRAHSAQRSRRTRNLPRWEKSLPAAQRSRKSRNDRRTREIGAHVTEVVAYRTLTAAAQDRDIVSKAMNADAVFFLAHLPSRF